MTEQQALQLIQEKYSSFPDLVKRMVGQFDMRAFNEFYNYIEVGITDFCHWAETKEGVDFWSELYDLEESDRLTMDRVNEAYKLFNINPL